MSQHYTPAQKNYLVNPIQFLEIIILIYLAETFCPVSTFTSSINTNINHEQNTNET